MDWINVNDRLPILGVYIVWGKDLNGPNHLWRGTQGIFIPQTGWMNSSGDFMHVTHWMSYPECPKNAPSGV